MTDKISNRTVLALAEVVSECFDFTINVGGRFEQRTRPDWLAELLFAEEYDERIVNVLRAGRPQQGMMKRFVLGIQDASGLAPLVIHTGATPPQLLLRLSSTMLRYVKTRDALVKPTMHSVERLVTSLELDGYEVRPDGRIVPREENVFDVEEEESALRRLYSTLGLEGGEQFARDLELTDEHYENGTWGDSIKHARDVLDTALLGVARAHAVATGKNLSRRAQNGNVRTFLKDNGVVTHEENEFLFALYGLLSVQGGHPNMSEREHARICRQYALTAVHFILLRWESMSASKAKGDAGEPKSSHG